MKNNKTFGKLGAVVLIAVMILSSLVLIIRVNDEQVPDKITLSFSFSTPVITQVLINGTMYDRVTMEGLPTMGDVGVPVLPVKPVNVLLPQRSVLESVDIIYEGNTSSGDGFHAELGRELVLPGDYHDNESNDTQYLPFNGNIPYPTEICQTVGVYEFRGYAILTLDVFPVHFIGRSGEIFYYQKITVVVKTSSTGSVNPLFRGYAEDTRMMQQKVDDSYMLSTYASLPSSPYSPDGYSRIVHPNESYDYVIITSEDLKHAQGEYTFQDLMNYKSTRGTRTAIVTVEQILNDPYYCNTTNHLFNDTPARIRNFIIDAYKNWGIEYVLIGGDQNVVPARYLRSENIETGVTTPSDLYYACLDGTFNTDEDAYWGEARDDENDLRAEVYVGRACVGHSDEVANFVYKTLKYENTCDSYLTNVTLAGEQLDVHYWGGDDSDQLIDGSSSNHIGISPIKYHISKLYDRTGYYWPKEILISQINNGTHIINHVGHSIYNYNIKMINEDVDALTNNDLCFIYSQGCYAGAFDNDNCSAKHFTVKTKHGAFAGIWYTREGFYGPSEALNIEFWDAIFGESQNNPQMRELGVALQDSKEDLIFNTLLPNFHSLCYGLNLFGDPQIEIKPAVIPNHEIIVKKSEISGYKSGYVPSHEIVTVNALILNNGLYDENNVLMRLRVDNTVADYTYIDIEKNGGTLVNLECILSSGLHEITIEIPPVPGENITYNNALKRTVIAI